MRDSTSSRLIRLIPTLAIFDIEGFLGEQLTIVMVSMHTSPLAQPGQGDAGGMNVYIRNLTTALIEAGHQVLGFTRQTVPTEEVVVLDEATDSKVIPLNVGPFELSKEALADLTTLFADELVTAVSAHAYHSLVVHSHYWLSGVVAHRAASHLKAPVVHTMHTLGAAKSSAKPGSEPLHRMESEALICARAQVVIANTADEKQELMKFTGVSAERVQVVHPGVDHGVFYPAGMSRWPGRQIDQAIKILFAGRMQEHKGPHVLLEALAALQQRDLKILPVAHFTGAVSGAATYDVPAYAERLGIAQQCSFSSPVSPTVLASYMRAADVVAMPSASETFGLVAVEAQACGTPVIAHNVGGLTTAVVDGFSGHLVDSLDPEAWADSLAGVISDPQRWRCFGSAGANHSRLFSWSAMAERMIEIYYAARTRYLAA